MCDDDFELFRYMCDGVSRGERGACRGGADLVFIMRVVEFQHAGCVCKGVYVGARALEGGTNLPSSSIIIIVMYVFGTCVDGRGRSSACSSPFSQLHATMPCE